MMPAVPALTCRAPYIGRFAPSPSGALHMGSLVAALASYLDARLHQGQWLVRIEDIDETRSVPGAGEQILHTLQQLGMHWDGEVVWQSRRKHLYQMAFASLAPHAYACTCSRREIADSALRLGLGLATDGAVIYPGTCRPPDTDLTRTEYIAAYAGEPVKPYRTAKMAADNRCHTNPVNTAGQHSRGKERRSSALRLRVPEPGQPIQFMDRRLGLLSQDLGREVGDFVLQRQDGFWSYQMAVVVDDGAQEITHVVRGEDLIDSTARQIYLHQLLQQTTPLWLHVPVVRNANGEKLSKQTGATALDLTQPLRTLHTAAQWLELNLGKCDTAGQFWDAALHGWQQKLHDWSAANQHPLAHANANANASSLS